MKNKEQQENSLSKKFPHSNDHERSLCGMILIENDPHINERLDHMDPSIFYGDITKWVIWACKEVRSEGHPPDIINVTKILNDNKKLLGHNVAYEVSLLIESVGAGVYEKVVEYELTIKELYIRREMIINGDALIKSMFDNTTDIVEKIEDFLKTWDDLVDMISSGNEIERSTTDQVEETLKIIEENAKLREEKGLTGVNTGFPSINKATGGWQPTDLIILAARPGMGKSAFTIGTALSVHLDQDHGAVAYFSLEMSRIQLHVRLMSHLTDISQTNINNGDLSPEEWVEVNRAGQRLTDGLHIDDRPALHIEEIRKQCHKIKNKKGLSLVIIDYLQLAKGTGDNREQEIANVSSTSKAIAKELNVPVMLLSQLSRDPEKRTNKEPIISDLRESGAIEQDADIVSFLYRPEYYDITVDDEGNSLEGLCKFSIKKHRNGPLFNRFFKFNGKTSKFHNYEQPSEQPIQSEWGNQTRELPY